MPDFPMTHYYRQYQDAVTELSRIRSRLQLLKEKPLYVSEAELPDVYAEIEAAEAEYAAALVKADDLWCWAHTGKSRQELDQSRTFRRQGLQPKPHFPETPRGRELKW